jgi:lipopolysaccharide transport system permease protein
MIDAETESSGPPIARYTDAMANGVGEGRKAGDIGDGDGRVLMIRPQSGWIGLNWEEMWSHRELLAFLVWRDVSVRYKQTVLGPAWAILQPLIMLAIFTTVFGRFAGFDTRPIPYPVFVFAGLIPWVLFSQGMPQSALSLVNQQQMLTKVYFPMLFVPIAAAAVFLVDLTISLGIYAVMMPYYRVTPSWGSLWLVLLVPLTLVATLGIGVTLAALTVFYRDFKHIVPFLTQILMYATPIFFPTALVGPKWRLLFSLNPMFGIVTAYRSAILGLPWDVPALAISTATALGSFIFAIFYFRKIERRFADFA